MTALSLLATFVGGGTGAACRYGMGRYVSGHYSGQFQLGTFLINVSGCFALGLLATVLAVSRCDTALPTSLLATGFLGGYTTFSTYTLEAVVLYKTGSRRPALAGLIGSVLAGLSAAATGAGIGQLLLGV